MGCIIKKIDYYLPSRKFDNKELCTIFPEYTPEKLNKKLGIESRHISGATETALDMGIAAAEKVFSGYDRKKIDFLLFCTQSADHYLPPNACIAQNKLGLLANAGALDYNLGCSGYVYGLALAKGLINSGIAENVLLVTSDTYTKHIAPNDKGNRAIFGDGATATIIEQCAEEHIGEFALGTDGAGAKNLIVKNGLMRAPKDQTANDFLFMNGPEIFNFTINTVPGLVEAALKKNNCRKEEVDFFVFHQANKYMLDYLRSRTIIEANKFYVNLAQTGNTVSSSIPLALNQAMADGLINQGDSVMLVGFGVGYSYGATLIIV